MFTSALLFLPSINLLVQRTVFSEKLILMAGLWGKMIYMSSLLTNWLIDCLHIYKALFRSSFPYVMHTFRELYESWDALLSATLPALQEPSAPSSAQRAVFRLHSELWLTPRLVPGSSSVYVFCMNAAGKVAFHEQQSTGGQETTWICLRKSVSCFTTLIVSPDTFLCVILYLVLA